MIHLAIVNPHSFHTPDKMRQALTNIESGFRDVCGTAYKIHVSRYPRDAVAVIHRCISAAAPSETVRVYAVGGDGILFECLNGMIDFPNAELTSVPYGNANDFVRAFGEGSAAAFRDIRKLATAPAHAVDVINGGDHYALIEMNIGLIGQTIIRANALFPRIPKNILRKNIGLAYSVCGIMSMFNKEVMNQKYTITMDGKDMSGTYSNILLSNCPCDGGTLIPNPYSRPDSGFLEVVFCSSNDPIKVASTRRDFSKGHFEKHAIYSRANCKSMVITSDTMLRVQIDGEGFYARDMTAAIVPGGLKFFAPEGLEIADYSHKAYKGNKKRKGAIE